MDRDQYLWEGVHVMGSLSWSSGSFGMYPAYGHGPAGNVPIDLSPGYQYLSTVCTRLYPSPASNSYARSDQSTLYGSSPMVVYMLIRYHSRPEVIIWPFYISEHYSDPPIGVGSNISRPVKSTGSVHMVNLPHAVPVWCALARVKLDLQDLISIYLRSHLDLQYRSDPVF